MKTTIKLKQGLALVVEPVADGVKVDLTMLGARIGGDTLTLDQAGALLFAVEQAAEAVGIKAKAQGECQARATANPIGEGLRERRAA